VNGCPNMPKPTRTLRRSSPLLTICVVCIMGGCGTPKQPEIITGAQYWSLVTNAPCPLRERQMIEVESELDGRVAKRRLVYVDDVNLYAMANPWITAHARAYRDGFEKGSAVGLRMRQDRVLPNVLAPTDTPPAWVFSEDVSRRKWEDGWYSGFKFGYYNP
jgi:hypothetical protein